MESARTIKKRVRSVQNISQITKAMEAVSATKMRKSQEFAIRARPYAVAALEMLENLLTRTPVLPPLLKERPIKQSLLLVVTSDKGLAGAFNTNVLKQAAAWIEKKKSDGLAFSLVIVGKKAKDYFEHRNIPIEKSFWGFGDFRQPEQTLPISDLILDGFEKQRWDEVETVYTNFITTLKQRILSRKILPVTHDSIKEMVLGILPQSGRYAKLEGERSEKSLTPKYTYEYIFEPTPAEILGSLVPHLLRLHIHHIILESNASEHSARMVAMKNASDNAEDLIDNLGLAHNKLRQAGITREISEIISGAEAQEK